MKHNKYHKQVSLLIQALPIVMNEPDFSLKGGTAINLFVRDMPRLSVDIDLTFIPVLNRIDTIELINNKMESMRLDLQRQIPNSTAKLIKTSENIVRQIQLKNPTSFIKIEINHVLRGHVNPLSTLQLCERAQNEFGAFVSVKCLSFEDLYGGKLCAALSRQHPRDLFDVKLLLDNEGVSESLRKTFLVYLSSGNTPMSDMLNPIDKDVRSIFEAEFLGMNFITVDYEELEDARHRLIQVLREDLSVDEKEFLISLKSGEPDWSLLGVPGVENLPGIKWKLENIRKMSNAKRSESMMKLKEALGL